MHARLLADLTLTLTRRLVTSVTPPPPFRLAQSPEASTRTPAQSNEYPRDLARPTPASSIRDWINSPEYFYIPGTFKPHRMHHSKVLRLTMHHSLIGGYETIKTVDGYRRLHYKQKPGVHSALQAST